MSTFKTSRPIEASLPLGVHAVWDLGKAWHETTATRETICLNGLWRWQPNHSTSEEVPRDGWGWFKVPGSWPGISDYMEKDCQTVYANPAWKSEDLGRVLVAWYQRELTIPPNWKNRRISIQAEYVNSLATLFVDGKQAGHISFPSGSIDITGVVHPGEKHVLSIQLVALPLKGVIQSYSDTNAAKEMKSTVDRRGLCGDVYLVGSPLKAQAEEVRVATSTRNWTITIGANISGIDVGKTYRIQGRVLDLGRPVKSFLSPALTSRSLNSSLVSFTAPWKPAKLWDLNTPQNQYELELTLIDGSGKVLDVQTPKKFGFRELWIKGRDFILNGSRVFWSCVPVDNGAVSAGLSSYKGAKESLTRLKSFGINMVYTHNYDCNPGSFLAFDEILRAADDVGILVALTMPHFGDYDWSTTNAELTNGYARHAEFFAHVARNHPSVIAYATSHNATGYNEDTNPDKIDGFEYKRDSWALNNTAKALRAEAIINKVDPSRFVYHHSSGNLGTMHTMNFYLNWAPIQEMDDWYEHWATVGIKPAFMVEYGVPFSWDWAMYRGWYKGQRSFGSAQVPWEYCMAEWNAQFLGDHVYDISESEKRNLRWEAPKFAANQEWYRWDYPQPMGSTHPDFEDQQRVWAMYTKDNWRAFRTWGVSGISPWETSGLFWRPKPSVKRDRVELVTDWDAIQRPGYSPDYIDMAFEASDWVPTVGGESLIRNNRPLLAYIGGKTPDFTEKGHIFRAGETVSKELIAINNSRESVDCRCTWSVNLPTTQGGATRLAIETGVISRIPIHFTIPLDVNPGTYKLTANFEFLNRESQQDDFSIQVLPNRPSVASLGHLAIYDPKGESAHLMASMGLTGTNVGFDSNLAGYDTLIVGKNALTVSGPGPDLTAVRNGLKVILFEQTGDVLEKRFGFRVQEYGLRNVFPRVPDHPILAGLTSETLRDWRGDSTVIPPRLQFTLANEFNGAPSIVRNGMLLPHVWRCGCRGSVASVLIEKPACGDFLSLIDGGFSLQYSPLMVYREGKGMVLFCQMDVTGRTESDPAAERLAANIFNFVSAWHPTPKRTIVYAGDPGCRAQLEQTGFQIMSFDGVLGTNQVLVVGPGGGAQLVPHADSITAWLNGGGRALAIGLDQDELRHALPLAISTRYAEYINSVFDPQRWNSPLSGIGPADVYNRDPRKLPILSESPGVLAGGVLAALSDDHVILLQLAPWKFTQTQQNTKRVFRHTSVALTRLLGNLGVQSTTPLLARFGSPADQGGKEQRWLHGFYLDVPVAEDDPYRFFGW